MKPKKIHKYHRCVKNKQKNKKCTNNKSGAIQKIKIGNNFYNNTLTVYPTH